MRTAARNFLQDPSKAMGTRTIKFTRALGASTMGEAAYGTGRRPRPPRTWPQRRSGARWPQVVPPRKRKLVYSR